MLIKGELKMISSPQSVGYINVRIDVENSLPLNIRIVNKSKEDESNGKYISETKTVYDDSDERNEQT